ncbi:hypothetical protein [Companilactobacillus versmoldensis]|uniref:ABC-2 type transporter domain-containing protein n=1 Tax=Companilactobacillus versmoldensis DSM 14857 = KCTC 3814 TaxID=1423815 RepID=A0A0R1SDA3_9LACO|nr:hypothetical protein [Companilactobacillus versmoldensis]KRL67183.1 hypothetical protein FC27_GL002030 [Companilactobacillus versmoldensis DSM 14857 = KCTC 3814]
MTNTIQLKQVLRNKRFVLFTIIMPIIWYVMMFNLQTGMTQSVILGMATFIGIIGNCLATFSKRISSNLEFYSFQSRITKYTMNKYLVDQVIVQLVLNFLIFSVIFLVATIFFHMKSNYYTLAQLLLLTVMGLYFSVIGFALGTKVDTKILDAISFPIITIAAMTILPLTQFGSNTFIKILSKIQMIFPGYYYNNIMQSINQNISLNVNDITLFIVTVVLNLLPIYFVIMHINSSKKLL